MTTSMPELLTPPPSAPLKILGRYALYDEFAAGGMATVHLARLLGPTGFSRTVAVKRLHPRLAKDPDFVASFLDEARLAARIRHPNVVATLDVLARDGEVFLVMEYVHGESLSQLIRTPEQKQVAIPVPIAATIMAGVLHGLHAAHEAKNEQGQPLGIVHRDVSPQNVLIGVDGVPHLIDFGVAKAAGKAQNTADGTVKGKISYLSPEQIRVGEVTRRSDVFAAATVLWELVVGRKLFAGSSDAEIMLKVFEARAEPPSSVVPGLPAALDAVLMRALDADPERRFATARDMAIALEEEVGVVPNRAVGQWVEASAGPRLGERAKRVAEIESAMIDLDEAALADDGRTSGESRTSGEGRSSGESRTSGEGRSSGETPRAGNSSFSGTREIPRLLGRRIVLVAIPALLAAVIIVWLLARGGEPVPISGEPPSPSIAPSTPVVSAPVIASSASVSMGPQAAPNPSASSAPGASALSASAPVASATATNTPSASPPLTSAGPRVSPGTGKTAPTATPKTPGGKRPGGKDDIFSRD